MAVFSRHNLIVVLVSVIVFAGGIAYGVIDSQQVDRGATRPQGWTMAAGTNVNVGSLGVRQESGRSIPEGPATADLTADHAAKCGFGVLFQGFAVPDPSVMVLMGIILVTGVMRRRMKVITGQ